MNRGNRDERSHRRDDVLTLKVQRPLFTNDPARPWRFYDERRRVDFTMPEAQVPADLVRAMGATAKVYAKCLLSASRDAVVELRGVVEPQPW